MKAFFIIIIALFTSFTLQNCTGENPANPCENYTGANADFEMLAFHGYGNGDSSFLSFDTIYYWGVICYFNAKDKSVDSCWWKVGNDPRVFTKKTFNLSFSDTGIINTTLVTYKKDANSCGAKQYDTVRKQMWIMPRKSNPIAGKFKGVVEDTPNDSFEIEIKDYDNSSFAIYNFPNGCPNNNQYRGSFRITNIENQFFFEGNVVEGSFNCDVMQNLEKQVGSLKPTDYPHGYFDNNTGKITIVWWQRTKIDGTKVYQRRRVFYGEKI